jgi:hypothetical protein
VVSENELPDPKSYNMKKRLFLASNQLPLNTCKVNGHFEIDPADELTTSGLETFYSKYQTKWIGLTGLE